MRKQDINAILRLIWESERLEPETKKYVVKKLKVFFHCVAIKDADGASAAANEVARAVLKDQQ